jgi:hypothetical protein
VNKTPNIKENKELEQYFIDKLTEKYSIDREGIHVSDLVYCLKEALFKKYLKRPTSIDSLMFFLDGEQRHGGFQGLVPNLKNEDRINKYGIVATVDLFNPEENAPANKIIEIKTTRKKPQGEIASHYIRQGAYYCVLRGTRKFTLMTQHINHHAIIFLDVEFTKKEIDKYKKEMLEDAKAVSSVFQMVNEELSKCTTQEEVQDIILKHMKYLPEIRESMRWKCIFCLYNDLCNLEKSKEKA